MISYISKCSQSQTVVKQQLELSCTKEDYVNSSYFPSGSQNVLLWLAHLSIVSV
jgi:hypothetical protein